VGDLHLNKHLENKVSVLVERPARELERFFDRSEAFELEAMSVCVSHTGRINVLGE
jgi:hypothetical protein